jgi:hypothetical protein
MHRKPLLIALSILVLTSLACGFQFNLPVTQIKTGPLETETIQVALPENGSFAPEVRLTFGAGELKVNPGSERTRLDGTAQYNVSDFKPRISTSGSRVHIEQGSLEIKGIPNFNKGIQNEWDLLLPVAPLSLRIEAGAYKGSLELGGLAIEEIEVSDGASEVQLSFSTPNQIEMRRFTYTTGASDVRLHGLGNANFTELNFRSGAGNYLLDFSGPLQRDAQVTIESGISNIEILVPAGTNARLLFEGGLSNVDADGDWTKAGSEYQHAGTGPTLTILVKMGAGNLELSTDY